MTCFVICGKLLFLIAHLMRLLLRTYYDLNGSLLDFSHCYSLLVSPCSKQGGLVKKIFKIGTDKADRRVCNNLEVNIGS